MTFFSRPFPRVIVTFTVCFTAAACATISESTATRTPNHSPIVACTGSQCPTPSPSTAECACAVNGTPTLSPTSTLTPTASATAPAGVLFTPPSLLAERGMLALSIRRTNTEHIWLWILGTVAPMPLTGGDYSDRDPEFSPDGESIAFASNRDGNWQLYSLDIRSGSTRRLTAGPGYDARPTWSPDAKYVAYEHYDGAQLRICIIPTTGDPSAGPVWCSQNGAEAYEPTWSSTGRVLAFTGRTGLQTDIYTINLDNPNQILNLTNTPDLDESEPIFSPDGGEFAYAVEQNGYSWIYTREVSDTPTTARLNGQGGQPEWSPDGKWLTGIFRPNEELSYLLFSPTDQQVLSPAALVFKGKVDSITWTSAVLNNPVPGWILAMESSESAASTDVPAAGTPLSEQLVSINVNAPDPRLSSAVVSRFNALRLAVQEQAGWDFLGTLDNAATDLHKLLPPKELLSWLRTGRAFAVARSAIAKGWLVVLPDPLGPNVYWRLFVRTTQQDGTEGEPLRDLPWNFDARSSGSATAFDDGGAFFPSVPDGYYIDFTQLASDFGWNREASDPDWRTYYYSIRFWEFVCSDGLDWFSAMGELYSPSQYLTPTPSASPTPKPTMWWGPLPTNTRWPTWTPSPTRTP